MKYEFTFLQLIWNTLYFQNISNFLLIFSSFLFYFFLNILQIQTYKYKNFIVFQDKCDQKDFIQWKLTCCNNKFKMSTLFRRPCIKAILYIWFCILLCITRDKTKDRNKKNDKSQFPLNLWYYVATHFSPHVCFI